MKKFSRLAGPQIFIVLISFIFLMSSCKSRHADEKQQGQTDVEFSKDAVHITGDTPIDFSKVDTLHYFLGKVGGEDIIYKVNHILSNGLSGSFYRIDTTHCWMLPTTFSVKQESDGIVFISDGNRWPLDFDMMFDKGTVSGSCKVKGGNGRAQTVKLSFKKYKAPSYKAQKSDRFNKELYEFEVQKDVIYGHAKGFWSSYVMNDTKYVKMLLKSLGKTITPKPLDLGVDIYMPKDTFSEHPLLVLMHGGAFYFGDKGCETMRVWCEHFSKMGYVVASANYRLGFQPNKQAIQRCGYEAIQDANAVMRFLIHHAQEYGIDTNNVFVGGTSAGSITMLSMAFMTDANCPSFVQEHNFKKKLGSLKTADNAIRQPFKIKAVANMWGAVYDLKQISSHPVPIISFHGDQDNFVPFDCGVPFSEVKGKIGERLFDTMYGSKSIHHLLDSLHVRNEFYPLQGQKHAPYEDAQGHPNSYYYYIQDKLQAFFLKEIQRVGPIQEVSDQPLMYAVKQKDIRDIQWKVEGGFILRCDGQNVVVVWRQDAPKQTISATGHLKNGMSFNVQKKISKPHHV